MTNAKDPAVTDSDKYHVVFENDKVRVLEYNDKPGDITTAHQHPDSVMITLSSFRRKLHLKDGQTVVNKDMGEVSWLPAQEHIGENIGDSATRVILVEIK